MDLGGDFQSGDTPSLSIGDTLAFLGTGDIAQLIRSTDWNQTPLGPPSTWPPALIHGLAAMISSALPAYVMWGRDRITLYNDAAAKVIAPRHPGAFGKPYHLEWPEIWESERPIVEAAFGGRSTVLENHPLHLRRHGVPELTWFTLSYAPLRSTDGRIGGITCTFFETTASVRSEQRRAKEAERLKQVFETSLGFMAVMSGPDHVFEAANARYEALVGAYDLVGKPFRQALSHLPDIDDVHLIDDVYRTGRPLLGRMREIELPTGPGGTLQLHVLEYSCQPMRGRDGLSRGVFLQGYDVTDRWRAERALRESEARFRLIADSAPVPVWVTSEDGRRTFVNRAYADFLGCSSEVARTVSWTSLLHPEDLERMSTEVAEKRASGESFSLKARYRAANGSYRWLDTRSQPRVGENGEFRGFIGVAYDITDVVEAEAQLRENAETLERRVEERTADLAAALDRLQAEMGERARAEAQLRQAQKMEAVGQLTGGIAHDFNNLLTPIIGNFDLIRTRSRDEWAREIADAGLGSARRAARLTGQLLAFSRLQRITIEAVDVNAAIENLTDFLSHAAGKMVRVSTDLSPDTGWACTDSNQLENALLNLALNARDAMPNGGELMVATRRKTVSDDASLESGDYVCISVKDTGEGMSPDVLARATEPFFSTKPVGKGTGLGLPQVYGIARQSGGTLTIDSNVGIGTMVTIMLPVAEPVRTARAEVPAPGEPGPEGCNVLLIDDDVGVRMFMSDSLRALGHRVVTAESGSEGLEQLEEDRFDLVLLDFAMPDMNGAEVAAIIRERHPLVPILFITGYAESEQLEAALGDRLAVLRKPFTLDELEAAIAPFFPVASRLEAEKGAS